MPREPLNSIVIRTFALIGIAAALALGVGILFDAGTGWLAFSAAVAALLLRHLRQLSVLLGWLRRPESGDVPQGSGAWEDVFELLYRRERAGARRERELERALARFRQAAQAFPDGVVVLDEGNHIVWCNQTAERHLGLDQRADFGQPIANLVRQPEFVAFIAREEFAAPLELRTGRGEVLSLSVISYGDGQKLLHSRDVTQTERLETMRRDFVANVSHELRTPLTVLVGFLETVRELKIDPGQRRDYLNLMAEQGRRMHRIVEDLLTLSSLECAAPPPESEQVAVAPLLARLRAEAESLSAGRHRITLDAQGDFDLLGAEHEVASAFSNLVSNAVRYTPAGGDVRIAWRASGAGASFAVEDSGAGIEAEHIPRLTERFYRVDRGRSRETGGTGLGLAIVKHALQRHQATLEIESEPGKGSRFTATFPARRVAPARAAAQAASDPHR